MQIERLAAFSHGTTGGNPAGVVVGDVLPSAEAMQAVAAQAGYSETVFAAPEGDGWRVRYFSPEAEVPFCGHATIALGAVLATRFGDGEFALQLNSARISVDGRRAGETVSASLQSPPTHSRAVPAEVLAHVLGLFGYSAGQLDARLPPAIANAGLDHLVLALRDRATLAAMRYELDAGRDFMRAHGIGTIALVFAADAQRFHARNPFAIGGVYEDPATGAAAAALSGYLRDANWPHGGHIEILQGEDMGSPLAPAVRHPGRTGQQHPRQRHRTLAARLSPRTCLRSVASAARWRMVERSERNVRLVREHCEHRTRASWLAQQDRGQVLNPPRGRTPP